MKLLFTVIIVLLSKVYSPVDCSTKIIVTDCDDKSVAGVTVIVETCKNTKKYALSTDAKGEASFSLCKSEICRISISAVGYASLEISNVKQCCVGEADTVCKIKLCSD